MLNGWLSHLQFIDQDGVGRRNSGPRNGESCYIGIVGMSVLPRGRMDLGKPDDWGDPQRPEISDQVEVTFSQTAGLLKTLDPLSSTPETEPGQDPHHGGA